EHFITNKMIDATRGIVLTYEGKPVEAYFHSTSGGYTESSENVWGSYVPYLRGVVDYDQEAPKFSWEKSFTASEIENILLKAGYNIGKLKAIKLSPLKKQPVKTMDRGISGRVLKMTFSGEKGDAVLEGNKVRGLLLLNSTLFDAVVDIKTPKYIEVPVLDNHGNELGKKQISVKTTAPSKQTYLSGFENLRLITGDINEKIVFQGKGWGHGLGLSQWGARGMALAAPQNSKDYYKKILDHYYTNVKIEKIY
ncbi:MAG: SpoIID/LytB domain-containing protein, partial [Acidaminococcaceae bacterium]